MKNYSRALLLALATLAAPLAFGQAFGPEVRITNISGNALQPEIAAVGNNVYLTWNETSTGNGEIFFSRSTNGGVNFTAPVNLSNSPANDILPVIGVSSDGLQVHIMWTDEYNVGSVVYVRSTNGGANFTAPIALVDNGGGFYARPSSVLVDSNNCVHLAWYDNRVVGYGGIWHKMSCDQGANWSADTEVTNPDGAIDSEFPRMAEISKTLFVLYRTSTNGWPQGGWPPFDQYMYRGTIPASAPSVPAGSAEPIVWQRSPQKVSRGLPDEISNTYAGQIVTGANSALHVGYWAEKAGNNLFYRTGFPNGKGFGPVVNLSGFGLNHLEWDGNTYERNNFGIGEDSSQQVHVVFGQNSALMPGNIQVGLLYYRCSPDKGVTWMPRTLASNRVAQAGTVRAVWSATGNKMHIAWPDYRDNNSGAEIYYKNYTPGPCVDPNGDNDNDGIPNGVEALEGRNVAVKDNDIFTASNTGSRLFAMQQYRDFLGREGDAGGVDFYTNQLNGNANLRANIVENFFNSPEFQSVNSPIVRLYFAFFNRIPDYPGLLFQVNAYKTGTPLGVIANNFAASPEFISTYGSLNNTQYVQLLYQNVLGRTASQAEVNFHVNRLNNGATRGEVMVGFSESPEYTNLKANSVYITMMYVGMLRRSPDQGGFDFWLNYMNSNPGIALIAGFLNSPEYHNRFL